MSADLLVIAQYATGSVLVLGAGLKSLIPARQDVIGVLLPVWLVVPARRILSLVEAGLGLSLLLGICLPGSLWATAMLTFVILAGTVALVVLGMQGTPCGCFGGLIDTPVGWPLLARNLLLVIISCLALASSGTGGLPHLLVGTLLGAGIALAPSLLMLGRFWAAPTPIWEDR